MFVDPSEDDRRVAAISLTLITSKIRLSSPSDMSYARVMRGRWRITALMGFGDLRYKAKYARFFFSRYDQTVEKFDMFFVIALVPFLVLRNSKFSSTTLSVAFATESKSAILALLGAAYLFSWNCLLMCHGLGNIDIGTNRTNNTSPNSSSIVASLNNGLGRTENIIFVLLLSPVPNNDRSIKS
jgi:hypothetical protein